MLPPEAVQTQETWGPHGHDWQGNPVECCGSWNICRDKAGKVYLQCNDCGERRTITGSFPPILRELERWPGLPQFVGDQDFELVEFVE